MTSIYNNSASHYYEYLFVDLADPRTNEWFLIKSPFPGLSIIAAYLYFVLSWGPRYMKHRKPYELKNLLIVYNFFQVCVSCFLVFEAFDGLWLRPEFSFKCYPVDFTVNNNSMREARDVYIYFLAKITELLDTVFFVLRKKDGQITFLHMYHHTVMPMISWGCTKYYPGGHGTFVGAINSFVHIIMYAYYMLAACGPRFQPFLWWKRYITVLQMVQFLLVFFHNAQLLWVPCDYPKFSLYFTLPNAIFFIYLFNDFYVKAYKRRNAKAKLEAASAKKLQENNNGQSETISNGLAIENLKGAQLRQRVKKAHKNGEVANGFVPILDGEDKFKPLRIDSLEVQEVYAQEVLSEKMEEVLEECQDQFILTKIVLKESERKSHLGSKDTLHRVRSSLADIVETMNNEGKCN